MLRCKSVVVWFRLTSEWPKYPLHRNYTLSLFISIIICCFKGFLSVLISTKVSQRYTQGKARPLSCLSLLPQFSVPGHECSNRTTSACLSQEAKHVFPPPSWLLRWVLGEGATTTFLRFSTKDFTGGIKFSKSRSSTNCNQITSLSFGAAKATLLWTSKSGLHVLLPSLHLQGYDTHWDFVDLNTNVCITHCGFV